MNIKFILLRILNIFHNTSHLRLRIFKNENNRAKYIFVFTTNCQDIANLGCWTEAHKASDIFIKKGVISNVQIITFKQSHYLK